MVRGTNGAIKSAHRSKKAHSRLGSARLARWRWRPRHRELLRMRAPAALECVDGISAGRRNVRARRPRSPIGIMPFLFSPEAHGLAASAFVLWDSNLVAQSSAAFAASNSSSPLCQEQIG